MKDARWLRLLSLFALFPAGCGGGVARPDPPADEGIHGYANGCYAVEGFDGEHDPAYLRAAGKDAFAFSEPSEGLASRFFMKPSDLGTYHLYDEDRRYLTATEAPEGGFRLARVETLESTLTVLAGGFPVPAE